MNAFIDNVPVVITPLTPVHIGCGQDFEPTNYVISEGVLYHFDPATVPWSVSQRNALLAAAKLPGIKAILAMQRFFGEHTEHCLSAARSVVAVASGVQEQYAQRIGAVAQHEANAGRVINQLAIERTAHDLYTGKPYLPGSSLKGALRTAWLDALNKGAPLPQLPAAVNSRHKAKALEQSLLGMTAKLESDPFRLMRVADAAGETAMARVVFATNHKKRLVFDSSGQPVQAKGPTVRREVLAEGQYRALQGDIRISAARSMPNADRGIKDFAALVRACNRYYVPRLRQVLDLLHSRNFMAAEQLGEFRKMLADLQPSFEQGRAMLLRVGRHSGAESLSLDGVRSIKIMRGRGQEPEYSSDGAKTIWLAAESEHARSGLPFGWVLVELADAPEVPAVRAWCQAQPRYDLEPAHLKVQRAVARITEIARQQEQERVAQAEHQQREAEAQAARELARQSLSEQGLLMEDFITACQDKGSRKDPLNPGQGLYAQALRLSVQALESEAWSAADRAQLAQVFEEWLPKVIERLSNKDDWKAARKRLRLADLKGD